MKDIIFFIVVGLALYIFIKLVLKEPILFWKEKKTDPDVQFTPNKKNKKKNAVPMEEIEAAAFRELFGHVHKVENHMIRHNDNTFTMMAEVDPVNYDLLDQDEQEGIDATFEVWLAQLNYPVRIYLQNRFVDLTLPIQDMQRVMEEEDDLHPLAFEYGQNMINDLKIWQNEQPRFETKRYLIFDYKVDVSSIKADDAEELHDKTIDKAFSELYRRLITAKEQLRKAEMDVNMLTTDGIGEVLYFAFNRRKATKNHYRDVEQQEQLALYVTADQTTSLMIRVKGEIENGQRENKEAEIIKEEEEAAG